MDFYKKHLKKHRALICVCALILVLQAVCALMLPYLMGELVGVGIQQKGIDGDCPEMITPKAMEIFRLVLPEKEYESYRTFYEKDENMFILSDSADSQKAGEIYENGVMSGFYTALREADGKISSVDTSTLNSMMNIVTVNYLYNRLNRLEALTQSERQESYAMAQQAPEALKSQLAGFALPYFYADAGVSLEKTQNEYIFRVGALMLLCAILQIGCFVASGRLASKISADVESGIREEFLLHTADFRRRERRLLKADLYSVFSSDISIVGSITSFLLTTVLYAPFVSIGGIILSFMLSPSLSAIVFLTVAVAVSAVFIIYRITLPRYDELQKSYGFLVRFAKSSISQLYTVRTMQTRDFEKRRFISVADSVRKNERYVLKAIFTALSLVSLLSNIITALCVVVSGNSLLSSSLGIGDVIAFLQYSVVTVTAVTTLASTVLFAPRAKGSFENIGSVMAVTADVRSAEEGLTLSEVGGNKVEFKNVSLPGEKGLKNISFTAEKGEITALIGPTGCGKTSLLYLLSTDSEKESGEVLIDGTPVEEISLKALRKRISYAHSEPVIFSKSLRENMLLYGAESQTAIDEALKGAAVDFIEDEEAVLHNQANRFSGGQRSRIALAGALSKKAGIYVIDDCLRSVDAGTEEHILDYLSEIKEHSTVLLVTQRIKSLMRADKIIVFSKEGLESQGTHSELLKASEFYRELALSQGVEVTADEG